MTKDGLPSGALNPYLPDLFERLPFPIAILGEDDRPVFANREFREVFPETHTVTGTFQPDTEVPESGVYELQTISLNGLKAVVGREVSEVTESRHQLAKMEKLVSLGQIARGLADELSAVLADNLRCAEELNISANDAVTEELLEIIRSDARRAVELVRRFLGPVGNGSRALVPCNLNFLLDSVLQIRAAVHKSADILVTEDLEANLPSALIDADQIQQVLLCILLHTEQNFRHRSSTAGHIHIRSMAQDNCIRLLITRNRNDSNSDGVAELQEQMDTGFNLDFCAEVANQYGGRLCTWTTQSGTTIMLELPAMRGTGGAVSAGHIAPASVAVE